MATRKGLTVADLEDPIILDEAPNLDDLALVTVNVETRDGRQLSMVWAAENGTLSMRDEQGYGSDETGDYEDWTFSVIRRSP